MTSDDLNTTHGIVDHLHFADGPGGRPVALIRNAQASARVSLHGGQLLSYQPRGAATDVLYLSEQAIYQPGKAIRGGVPVCWPWFGPDPQGLGRPAHGFARTQSWTVEGTASRPDGATLLTLCLTDSPATRLIWPHAFRLSLVITVGATLTLALTTHNTGDTPFAITQALHSYFAVGDIAQTRVIDLDGCKYIDNAAGAGAVVKPQTGELRFTTEVDRIYTGAPAELTLEDGARQRRMRITSEGSRTTVVWNPWAAIAAGMADLPDDGYRRFVCVETANAADEVITVPPGATHRMAVTVGVS